MDETFLSIARFYSAVIATRLAAFATGFTGFFRAELVRVTALMGSTTALAGDFLLLLLIHTGKATSALPATFV